MSSLRTLYVNNQAFYHSLGLPINYGLVFIFIFCKDSICEEVTFPGLTGHKTWLGANRLDCRNHRAHGLVWKVMAEAH